MMLALVIGVGLLVAVAFAIGGNLARIASALEAQNDHYGIGADSELPTSHPLGVDDR